MLGACVSEERQGEIIVSAELIDRLLERVWNPLELKTVLTVIALGGSDRPIEESRILGHDGLRRGAHGDGSSRPVEERIREALDRAVVKQVVLPVSVDEGSRAFIIWSDENLARYGRSRAPAVESTVIDGDSDIARARARVFSDYEQHIGVLTPVVADRLADAVERYPPGWVSEAIGQASIYNRRSLRYVERILENWATEGRNGEADRRDHEEHPNTGSRLRDKLQPYLRRRE